MPDAVQTLSKLPMSYRWSPLPRWPAAQAEAALGAGAGAGAGAGRGLDVLDTASLNRLRELDPGERNGLLQRVLRTYTQSLERMLVQWREARAAADANAMRVIAHTLKSSSASVGALALARTCAEVESNLRLDPGRELAPDIQRLLAESAAALVAVRAMLRP